MSEKEDKPIRLAEKVAIAGIILATAGGAIIAGPGGLFLVLGLILVAASFTELAAQ